MSRFCGCSCVVGAVSVLFGVLYSGFLARSGTLQWIDTWDPAGRGLRWHGETPWLVPQPWAFKAADIPNLSGRVILVTGANSGLGYWTSLLLARRGASVVLACRSAAKCEEARAAIDQDIGPGKAALHAMELDLASFASIRSFAAAFALRFPRLHSLVLNAGVMLQPFQLTQDRFELTVGTNHFGHFLLTKLLLPLLDQGARQEAPATISVHSSAAIFEAPSWGVDHPFSETYFAPVSGDVSATNGTWYNEFEAYRQSKLANVMFALSLAPKLQGKHILVNAHAPGAVRTNLLRHVIGEIGRDGPVWGPSGAGGKLEAAIGAWGRHVLLKYVLPLHRIVWDPEDACLTQVFTAVGTSLVQESITGGYFQSVARRVEPDPYCQNDTLRQWLWRRSEEAVGERFS